MKQIRKITIFMCMLLIASIFTACAADDYEAVNYDDYEITYDYEDASESDYDIDDEADVNADDKADVEVDIKADDKADVDVDVDEDIQQTDIVVDDTTNVESADTTDQQYYFRNGKLLTQHYEKHGIEMGFSSKEEYETAASAVIANPAALFKYEAEDGDGVYYLEDTNEFAILSTDGYIRTYFYPSAGKAYFDRQ